MTNAAISSWIRQCRYKTKRHGLVSDITLDDIYEIIKIFKSKCAYCGSQYDILDHLLPINKVPIVPANVTPICSWCKKTKRNNDIVWMFTSEKITKEQYLGILDIVLQQRGNELVKNYINNIIGIDA